MNSFLAPSAAGAALAFRGAGARSHGSARALSRYDGAEGKRTHPHALMNDYRSASACSQFVGTRDQVEPVWLYALYKDGCTRRRPRAAPGFAAAGSIADAGGALLEADVPWCTNWHTLDRQVWPGWRLRAGTRGRIVRALRAHGAITAPAERRKLGNDDLRWPRVHGGDGPRERGLVTLP